MQRIQILLSAALIGVGYFAFQPRMLAQDSSIVAPACPRTSVQIAERYLWGLSSDRQFKVCVHQRVCRSTIFRRNEQEFYYPFTVLPDSICIVQRVQFLPIPFGF